MRTIGIVAQSLSTGQQATFKRLGESLSVSFELRAVADGRGVDGWVILAADQDTIRLRDRLAGPCYFVMSERECVECGEGAEIIVADRPTIPAAVRGRAFTAEDGGEAKGLPAWLDQIVPAASKNGCAVWATGREVDSSHHYVSMSVPELTEHEPLFAHFGARRMAALLPLIVFVRSIADERGWEFPPLQATFMFDDPNLHWTSYGFIDYNEMVARATEGNYHVAMATIPLDAWFVHQPAAEIFKRNRSRVSFLVHGNDHVSNELAQRLPEAAMHRVLCQAVGRVRTLEARSGVEVARVMAPPHGACSELALAQMARAGFEAVCVSRGSLRYHNPDADWTTTIGMRPCDVVAGLPIIPRFGLSKNCRNDVLIAALLRQPIVPMTHHQAVANGYDLLDEMGSFINSLGDVQWRDMTTIARSLYARKRSGDTLTLRMFSRRITVAVPGDIRRVEVQPSSFHRDVATQLSWRTAGRVEWNRLSPHDAIDVAPGDTLEITSGLTAFVGPRDCVPARNRLFPIARRLMTEGRDRALPSFRRFAKVRSQISNS